MKVSVCLHRCTPMTASIFREEFKQIVIQFFRRFFRRRETRVTSAQIDVT
jgi:hypothetical protein